MHAPLAITPSKNEVDPLPLFRHTRGPPSGSGKIGRDPKSRSLHQGVQELETGGLLFFRIVFLPEPLIHLHRRYLPGYNRISPRVLSGWGAVEVPH